MPLAETHPHSLAYITHEGDELYLCVLCDATKDFFRFKVDYAVLARLNAECAARLLTRVQGAFAFLKDGDNVLFVSRGPN